VNKKGGPVWWKVIIGTLLVYTEAKHLFFPGTRALQPSNPSQAAGMLVAEYALVLLGAWLIFSGIRARRGPDSN